MNRIILIISENWERKRKLMNQNQEDIGFELKALNIQNFE